MPDFTYTARAATGQQSTGTLTAASEREVMALLDQRGLFPVRIQPAKATAGVVHSSRRRIKTRFLASLYAQLADLLHAGVPLLRSLEILERQTHHPGLAEILRDVRARVADGTSLADALAQHAHVFNELTVSMIRAGQEGGFLEDVLKRIAEFTNHQEDLKSKVVGAMAYPVFLSGIGTLIVFGLVIFLVPRFEEMFERQQAAGELPTLTILLLATSRMLTGSLSNMLLDSGALWLAVGMVGLWFLFRRWVQTDNGRRTVDRWRLALPGAGPIYRSYAIARFCRILGTMLHNGIPILVALRIAKDSTGNRVLTDAIAKAAENVTGGKSLSQPLAASGQFPTDVVEMVAIGEESNTLENVLVNIADSTERRTSRQLELFVRLLEPVMLLIMAGVTLIVVLALLLPFLKMGQTMVG
jgi:general secretion pathway protein F/type IV pilus assembly protein PilC